METSRFSDFLSQKPQGFLIVGLGASAGGIRALQHFFEHVPEDSRMAYVVILHLSPDHDSQLAQVLQAVTTIPVTQVTEKVTLEPDHIYVVPPNQHLILEGRFIAPSVNVYLEERRAPVDIFLRNLADLYGPRAISVILSGTGANGSMGLKRIKERGGATYAQNPREAEFNEMPRHAIATDLIDEVLPVAEIPGRLVAYRDSLAAVAIAVEPEQRPEPQQQALREIFTQLRLHTGHDFSNYKRPTLLRRIERRISVRNLPDLPSYTAFLHRHPEESQALLKDLLISVTNFFRDKKPFQALEQDILPAIFRDRKSEEEVRIWVAGCATGEEAYSLAMLVAERTWGVIDAPKVQLFATDLDEAAIATAREGLYTLNDAADVSPERLLRFFNKEGEGYRVKREIREMVLFANHNFLKDPPFSRLDLVTCRNVLIYLNGTAQERVMETFHFALKPGGFLFLGNSESVDGASDLYATMSREHHLYQARQAAVRHYPVLESVPALSPKLLPAVKLSEAERQPATRISFGELHRKLLEQYAPPSLVVNEEYDILHMSEKVGAFLEFSGGEPTNNLLKLVRPELRLELRSALYQARQRQTAMEARNVGWRSNGERQSVNIHVKPVTKGGDTAKGLLLVIFEPNEQAPTEETAVLTSDEPLARQLEEELMQVKARLRLTAEQHEYQAEELKASNEELQAMNEELRSAAEELETSKEELQSINEELRTVNQELKVKIEEISVTSNNLQNLINSADVATIFLDRALCIRLYTPAARQIFNLIPSDYGRPVSDITHRLEYGNLLPDAETVLDRLTVLEREVTTSYHRTFMMRVLPYRTSEDRINGVVVTFFDVTGRKQAEEALRQSEERLRLLIESAQEYAIITLDTDRKVVSWSSGAHQIFGYPEAEIIGKPGDLVFVPEDRDQKVPEKEVETARREGRAENERWHLRKDGSRFWGSGITQPLREEGGKPVGFVKIMRDLTAARRLEEARFFLAAVVETSNDSVVTIDFQRNITSWNKAAERLYGYTAEEAIGRNLTLLTLPEDFVGILSKVDAVEHSREVVVFDTVRHTKEGEPLHLEIVMSPVLNASGEVIGVSTIARDVSERKRREANLAFLAKINLDFAPLLTLQEVMEPVGEQLARYLRLSGCQFSLVDEDNNRVEVIYEYRPDESRPSWMGAHRLSDTFTEEGLRHFGAGKSAVFSTVADSAMLQDALHTLVPLDLGSRVDVPNLEGGRWRFLLTVGRAQASEWGSDELDLLQELAAKLHLRLERARAEEALRKSEEQFRLFVTVSSDMVYRMSADWTQMQNLVGKAVLADTPAPSPNWMEGYLLPEDQPLVRATLEQAIQNKSVFELEHRVIRADGGVGWVFSRAIPMLNKKGEINEWLGAGSDITLRKAAERQLRDFAGELERQVALRTVELEQNHAHLEAYRDLLKATLDSSFDMIQVFKAVRDENGQIIDFTWVLNNHASQKAYGNVIGKSLLENNPGVVETGIFDCLVEVTQTGEPQQYERHYVHEQFNGWFCQSVVKLGDGVATSTADITSRKQAEETIREQAHFITSVTETVPDMISVMNHPSRQIVYANREPFVHQGFDADALKEMDPESRAGLIHPDDREGLTRYYHAFGSLSNEEVASLTYRARSGSLAWQWFHVRGKVFARDPAGRPEQILNVVQNINRQKEAESEVMKNLTLLQQTEAVARIGSWDYDCTTGEFYWSDGMYQLFGLAPGTPVSPQAYLDYAVEEDRPVAERIVRQLQDGPEPMEESLRIRVDGQVLTLRIKAAVLADEAGRPRKMVGVDLDYSELKRLEAENLDMRLKQQKRLLNAILEAQEEEKDRIAESLHNGLAQQLYAARIRLENVPVASGGEQTKAKALSLLGQAIEQTRDLSHELTPRMLEQFGLAATVEDFCNKLSSEQLLIRCKVTLAGPLEKPLEVALYRISQELANNIFKHAKASAASLRITQQDQQILLEAKDDGQGFDAEQSRKKGLGLASIRSRVDLLGGRLEVDSSPGKGALIRIRLPLA